LAVDLRKHWTVEGRRALAPGLDLLLRILRPRHIGDPARGCHVFLVQALSRLWSWQRTHVPVLRRRDHDPQSGKTKGKGDPGDSGGKPAHSILLGAYALRADATRGRGGGGGLPLEVGPAGGFGRRAVAGGNSSSMEGAIRGRDTGR